MIFDSLITPMNFVIVKDALSQFLANERDNQIRIAKQKGKDEDWIEQNINFAIYPKRYRMPNAQECPCVIVYFDGAIFPEDEQYCNSNCSEATLNLEMYAVGTNEDGDYEQIIKNCDENAEDRLNYLLSQIYKILSSEAGFDKGTAGLVTKSILNGWQDIAHPEMINEAYTILGKNLKYILSFQEPTQMITPVEIREIYTTLNIQDEFIDPLVKIILEEDNGTISNN